MTTTAKMKTAKPEIVEPVEMPPKYAPDSVEAQALARVRAWFAFSPGPLPPLGSGPSAISRPNAERLLRACQGWANSGRRPGYFTQDVIFDHEPLGRTILVLMGEIIRKHDRVAVADALGEQTLLTGGTRGQLLQNDERMLRVAGELISIQRRLDWMYEVLPKDVASFRPLPPGPVGRRLHARRKELLGLLDDAFSNSHLPQGASLVSTLLQFPHPGTPAVAHAIDSWVTVADAIRNGAEPPAGFAEDWAAIVPAACEQFDEWTALAEWVLKVN